METIRDIWNTNAAFWDEKMGDGNLFARHLLRPAIERLLQPASGQQILDVACGNGVFARWLAGLGAQVVACDFSERFIELAKARGAEGIDYRVVDATREEELRALGAQRFDAVLCSMALMDMEAVDPLFASLRELLKPGGRFVFAIQHPCFNSNAVSLMLEQEDRAGELVTRASVRVSEYLHVPAGKGIGIAGQPVPHYYFHRPLSELLSRCFAHGLVLEGLEEPAFQGMKDDSRGMSWVNFEGIPPVLVARLRRMN